MRMIKRETLTRLRLTPVADGEGGSAPTVETLETIPACVSIETTFGDIQQYGVAQQMVIHTATDVKLDEYVNTRYQFSGKRFKLMRQVKRGNEYFAVLVEINE